MTALETAVVIISIIVILAFAFVAGIFIYTVYINHQTPDITVCNSGERLDKFCKSKDCIDTYYHWTIVNKTNCNLDSMDSDNLTDLIKLTGYTGAVHEYTGG